VDNVGIYATCNNGSVQLFKNNSLTLIGTPIVNASVFVRFIDSQKRLWFSSPFNGLLYYKDNDWTFFTAENSGLFDNVIPGCGSIIFETADKKIISGSADSGLQVLDGIKWKPFPIQPSLKTQKQIRCCAYDSSGAIWIGTNAGVLRFYDSKWYYYTADDYANFHAPYYNTYDVVVDKKNRVWFSMLHDGVFMLDQTATPNQCNVFKKLKITSPVKSGAFTAGVIDSIVWNSYGNIDSISLCYKTAIDAEWVDIFPLKRNVVSSSRRWIVPSVTSNDCYLRIRDWEDSTVEDITGPFSIVAQGTNISPAFTSLSDSITAKANETTTLTIHATDPEKDTIKFTYANLPAWVSASDSVLTFKPLESNTGFTFTVTVSDGKGGSTTDSVKVVVSPSTGNKAQFRNKSSQIFFINKTASLLSITSGATSTIYSAARYTLSGKNAGVFSQHGKTFTLERNAVSLNGSISKRQYLGCKSQC